MANEEVYAGMLRQDPTPAPSPEMLGTGTARVAADTTRARQRYNVYATEAMMGGESAMTFEEFMASGK
jgi:hypothetical protein